MELEDHEEDDMEIVEPPSNYIDKIHPLSRFTKNPSPVHSNRPHLPSNSNPILYNYNYKECLKNHAVAVGGHALDGCCEFMPAGPHGSLDALKCAACNCHRNFHRRDITDDGESGPQYISYWRGPRMLALPSSSPGRKRVRTKFTEEQKEKMVEMAEKMEWRIQKKDEAAVMEFCNEIGVKRRVLKVWMHNNKNTFRKESKHN
ncbi:zinc-finger homeodomain protein 10-like [Benincasa hispida]|uniref:zinc-finger homeodomain protein 10-like n=1 Tax=Benincasa hispida TaxID=102211 RepID=UPI001900BC1C|nr:zinc-finger homeodomain protein 10-like [Benincasa hispida]